MEDDKFFWNKVTIIEKSTTKSSCGSKIRTKLEQKQNKSFIVLFTWIITKSYCWRCFSSSPFLIKTGKKRRDMLFERRNGRERWKCESHVEFLEGFNLSFSFSNHYKFRLYERCFCMCGTAWANRKMRRTHGNHWKKCKIERAQVVAGKRIIRRIKN